MNEYLLQIPTGLINASEILAGVVVVTNLGNRYAASRILAFDLTAGWGGTTRLHVRLIQTLPLGETIVGVYNGLAAAMNLPVNSPALPVTGVFPM